MWIYPHRRARNTRMWSFISNTWGQTAQISLAMKRRIISLAAWVKDRFSSCNVRGHFINLIPGDWVFSTSCRLILKDFPKLFPYPHLSVQQFDTRWRDWNIFDLCCEYSYPYVLCFHAVERFVGHCLSAPNCSEMQIKHACFSKHQRLLCQNGELFFFKSETWFLRVVE